ncbi:MAG: chorismate mutase [Nanoarchaeota archaeon]
MEIEEVRKKINEIDYKIIELIVQRFKLVKEVALHKFTNNLPLKDPSREKALIEDRNAKFEKLGFKDSGFVSSLYSTIIKKSIKLQKNYMKKHKKDREEKLTGV